MKRPIAALVVISLVLSSMVAYFWIDSSDPELAGIRPVEAQAIDSPSTLSSSEAELATPISVQDTRQPALPLIETNAPPEPEAGNNIGMRNETSSVEFSTYLALTALGYEGQIDPATGKYRNELAVRAVQQEHDLSDDELQKYLEYSRSVIQADTQFQTKQQDAICSKRAKFSSLQEFGNAVNEFSGTVRQNQETIARQAESELGQSLFLKISSRVLSKPLPEFTEVDSSALFVSRDEDLSTVIERFCSYGK